MHDSVLEFLPFCESFLGIYFLFRWAIANVFISKMQALANDQVQRPERSIKPQDRKAATILLLDLTLLFCICQQYYPKLCIVHNLEEHSQSVC